MPIDFDIGDGADALGRNQLSDALDGTYWVSGWDATLGTGDLEVDIAAGEGAINGGDVSTGAVQTVDFTGDVDGTEPRKGVISVDDTGTVQKTLGTAVPAGPSDEVRFRTYDPAPPTNAPGVVVAEVWLAAGTTSLTSDDVRDRRVSNDAVEELSIEATLTAGSYTDETSNRALDTTYTNNTGGPLYVKVVITYNQDGTTVSGSFSVDGLEINRLELRGVAADDFSSVTMGGIVPDGANYTASKGFGAGEELGAWYEQELDVNVG